MEEFAIQNKKKKIKVIAYNGARFDNLFLLKAMFNNNLTTDLFLGGTVTNLKYIKTGNLIIQDMLMMVGGGSLNNACKVLIGPEYQKHDCPEILEINSIAAWESMDWPIQEKIKHYCCQDVLLLFSLYQRLATNLSSLAS